MINPQITLMAQKEKPGLYDRGHNDVLVFLICVIREICGRIRLVVTFKTLR